MEREHKGDDMNLHDKGTDRLLRDLDIKPEGTPTPSPRAYAWRLRGQHYKYADGQELCIIGSSTHAECRRELDRRRREGWTGLHILPDAPLAILGPGGTYTREIR